jgi:hypothetical protein
MLADLVSVKGEIAHGATMKFEPALELASDHHPSE